MNPEIMMTKSDAYIPILPYLRQAPGEHTYLPKKTGISQ